MVAVSGGNTNTVSSEGRVVSPVEITKTGVMPTSPVGTASAGKNTGGGKTYGASNGDVSVEVKYYGDASIEINYQQ